MPYMQKKMLFLMLCIAYNFHLMLYAYPLIESHSLQDINYKQFTIYRDSKPSRLLFFEYRISSLTSLQDISDVIKISLETLISANRSSVRTRYKEGAIIIVPTQNGIFMSLSAKNDVEFLLYKRLAKTLKKQKPIIIRGEHTQTRGTFYFFQDITFSTLEKNTWNIQTFRPPVLQGTISSGFGYRISPISGRKNFHKGVDIASSSGSEIFASKSGVVKEEGFDSIFGYFIILQHDTKYESLYGHLLDKKVKIGDKIEAGQLIATMGSTGTSTGSHVHFEIRKNKKPQNPLSLMVLRKKH